MINNDTIELLKECNAGIKMGVNSIDEVLDKVKDNKLKTILVNSKKEHQVLGSETHSLLNECDECGKEPNLMAQGMSWLKTNIMIAMEHTDKTIADLMTDGCDMGTKSINKYLNQYQAASEDAKNIAKRLIDIEDKLSADLRCYL